MIYSLLITAAPLSGHTSLTAARFAENALARGHRIHRVFFLDAGTLNGGASAVPAQDETDAREVWQSLGRKHGLDLVLCVTSALREGMLDSTEAQRHEKTGATTHPAFTIAGLGQLVDACSSSDRVVTFGA
jgi:tRNA 2-thiouridine synthesizing protein D